MKISHLLAPATIAAVSSITLGGCSNAGGQFSPSVPTTLAAQARHQSGVSPAACLPTLWTSSLSTNAVYGYTGRKQRAVHHAHQRQQHQLQRASQRLGLEKVPLRCRSQ